MWLFLSRKDREFLNAFQESRKLKETTPEEDWDISMWLLDPVRTVEELDYFTETGQRPANFIKMLPRAVEYPSQEKKPLPNFPQNPAQGHTWLDGETGTYYRWSGTNWKVIANVPPPPKKRILTKEDVKGVLLSLERPLFTNQLEEKEWCAREVSLLLGCEIQVFERNGVGYVVIDGRETRHPVENWGWREKKNRGIYRASLLLMGNA